MLHDPSEIILICWFAEETCKCLYEQFICFMMSLLNNIYIFFIILQTPNFWTVVCIHGWCFRCINTLWDVFCSEVSVCISGLEEFKQYDVVPCSISIGDQLHVSEVESCFQPYGPPARLSASHNDSEHTYMHPTNHSKLKPTITVELAINLTAEELENTYTIPMLLLSTSLPLMFAYSFFFKDSPYN